MAEAVVRRRRTGRHQVPRPQRRRRGQLLDVKPIGYTNVPEIVYGFGFSLQWKAFDFSAFFQGVGHVSFSTRTDQTLGFNARNSREANLFSDVYDNYWTPERLDAKYPRLYIGTNNNNNQTSTFWMANGRYMRLKNLEIGYTLPKRISRRWPCRTCASISPA